MLTGSVRILNPDLLRRLAALGHGDLVVIADAGLPIPVGVPTVDLSLVPGVPSFEEVLGVVVESLVVESATYAEEADESPVGRKILHLLGTIESIS